MKAQVRSLAATRTARTAVLSLVLALALAGGGRAAWAQSFVQLEIDRVHKVVADQVTIADGYLEMTLPLSGSHKVRVPLERVTCKVNCPTHLIELAQAAAAGTLPRGASGFQAHGSNTIGSELMPRLIREYLEEKQASPQIGQIDETNMRREIIFSADGGANALIEIHSKGSGTGYEKLRDKVADIWMSSRPANTKEIKEFRDTRLGDLENPVSEHAIALDGLAVIVHRNNPVGSLSIEQIARIFSGEIKDWSEVDGPRGAIKVLRRNDASGTTSTFQDLVMSPTKRTWGPAVKDFVESKELETEVARDEAAIGFIGFGFITDTKPLAIRTSCGMAYRPDKFTIKTEEYPLSRRLFLYTRGKAENEIANDVIKFAYTDKGQKVVSQVGFVDLGLDEGVDFDHMGGRLANMLAVGSKDLSSTQRFLDTVRFSRRLPLSFRFKDTAVQLDNKGLKDLATLAEALTSDRITGQFMLIGFSDDRAADQALQLSEQRARTVAKALQTELNARSSKGKPVMLFEDNVKWFGAAAPVACNVDDKGKPDEKGRALNRRVEVWLR